MAVPDHLKDAISALPREPGVYFFKFNDEILYIGKATSLRDRVRSYYSDRLGEQRNARVVQAIKVANSIEFTQTPSVIEALILEANLIKKLQPHANTREKDDKSYSYVIITKEEYPRVYVVRGKELQTAIDPDDIRDIFGPFTNGRALKTALNIVRKIFPFRGQKDPVVRKPRVHSALNEQLGLAPKLEGIPRAQYLKNIRNVKLFFEGKKPQLIQLLKKEMIALSKQLKFEEAEKVKRALWSLDHIKDSSLIRDDFDQHDTDASYRIEAYDIAHIMGSNMVGVMVVVDQKLPHKGDYRKFNIKTVSSKSDDTKALKEVLERRFGHDEWKLPKLIVIDGGKAQWNAAHSVLNSFGYKIPIVSVVKGQGHKPKGYIGDQTIITSHEEEILLANSEAHRFALAFHQDKRRIK